jgi:hypothetical protein
MTAAREAIGPAVKALIDPVMTAPTRLFGTGEVVHGH